MSGGGTFPTTRHSALVRLREGDAAARRQSWEALASVYWKPVYKYLRVRFGVSPDDASDLAQGFFLRALEKGFLEGYDPARARFRTFLRSCLDAFVANERQAARRLKRGGGVTLVSLDAAEAEEEIGHGTAPADDPERYFQEEWVRRLFELGVSDLRALCTARGKETAFAIFESYDLDGAAGERPTYAALAAAHGVPVTQVTNFLAFARRELRRLLLGRLAAVTGSDAELRREARVLLGGDA